MISDCSLICNLVSIQGLQIKNVKFVSGTKTVSNCHKGCQYKDIKIYCYWIKLGPIFIIQYSGPSILCLSHRLHKTVHNYITVCCTSYWWQGRGHNRGTARQGNRHSLSSLINKIFYIKWFWQVLKTTYTWSVL